MSVIVLLVYISEIKTKIIKNNNKHLFINFSFF